MAHLRFESFRGRSMAGQRVLVPLIGVRILSPEPAESRLATTQNVSNGAPSALRSMIARSEQIDRQSHHQADGAL